ncbi:hypothetical protein BASA81_004742 [Batrachochytrium salamandrivorans]|nr:hypothetical protein BASA81_004742 [Batrachochytrium salamandrivorans]
MLRPRIPSLPHPRRYQLQHTRTLLFNKTPSTTEVLSEVAELCKTPQGSEALARELGAVDQQAVKSLQAAMLRLATSTHHPVESQVTWRDLRLVALEAAVPFVGFGFIDNSGMIIFGDAIDETLGVMLCVSTLTSAALGNTVADICGIGLGGAVATAVAKLGLPTATLTLKQTLSKQVRYARTVGSMVGVVIGCVLGMFPLLFLDDRAGKLKRERKLDELFIHAVEYIANDAMNAESASLFVVDGDELWTRASKDLGKDVRLPLDSGLVGKCACEGMQVMTNDAYAEPSFNRKVDESLGKRTRSVLCTPLFDCDGNVLGVIEVVNKKDGKFTEDDARTLAALASHFAVALDDVNRSSSWVDVVERNNPLLDALKAHQHSYLRFSTPSSQPSSSGRKGGGSPYGARLFQWVFGNKPRVRDD